MTDNSGSFVQELMILAADVGLTYLFYKMYQSRTTAAHTVENLKTYDLESDIVEQLNQESAGCKLATCGAAYGIISGFAYDIHGSIKSQYYDIHGPMRSYKRSLLRRERFRGHWSDQTSVITTSFEHVPFALFNFEKTSSVLVEDPRTAQYLEEAMVNTHDHFEPTVRTIAQSIYDTIVGHVDKGIQTTEKMLKNGMKLLGVGRLIITPSGKVELSAPTNSDHPYIITAMSKKELITEMKSKAFVFKVLSWLFGVTGVIIVWLTIRPRIAKLISDYQSRRAMEDIRRQLRDIRSDASSPANDNACVVCLENGRECLLRPCGHVCVCLSCYEALPNKICPVCRRPVEDIIPVFLP